MEMIKNKILSAEITVPPNIAVFTDKKTGVKTVAFPFQFPSGENGILSLTKLIKMGWIPSSDIKKITIEFI